MRRAHEDDNNDSKFGWKWINYIKRHTSSRMKEETERKQWNDLIICVVYVFNYKTSDIFNIPLKLKRNECRWPR